MCSHQHFCLEMFVLSSGLYLCFVSLETDAVRQQQQSDSQTHLNTLSDYNIKLHLKDNKSNTYNDFKPVDLSHEVTLSKRSYLVSHAESFLGCPGP